MTKEELMLCLHQYTPWETLHLKNRDSIQDIEILNQGLEHPLGATEKGYGLHLAHRPDSTDSTFSECLFFPDKAIQDISIVQHDRFTPPELHCHDFFELLYVYEGEFIQQISVTKQLMHTGDFCLIPPHVYHSLDIQNYSIVLNILIPKTKLQDIVFNSLKGDNVLSDFFLGNTYSANANNYIIFHTNGDLKLQNLILDMCLEVLNRNDYYLHFLNTNLLLLFGILLRSYGKSCDFPTTKAKKDDQNFAILKYFETNYKTLTLQMMAEYFHYSPQHMSHRLKQITGLSFTEFLLKKRMEIASDLLVNTNIKIKYISEEIGYSNQEHFIRTFRKYYGISPGSYRNTHHRPDSNF